MTKHVPRNLTPLSSIQSTENVSANGRLNWIVINQEVWFPNLLTVHPNLMFHQPNQRKSQDLLDIEVL
jgi:hypothetical protein